MTMSFFKSLDTREAQGCKQMVDRYVEEALNLTRMKVHGQNPRRSCHRNQIGNEFSGNGARGDTFDPGRAYHSREEPL